MFPGKSKHAVGFIAAGFILFCLDSPGFYTWLRHRIRLIEQEDCNLLVSPHPGDSNLKRNTERITVLATNLITHLSRALCTRTLHTDPSVGASAHFLRTEGSVRL